MLSELFFSTHYLLHFVQENVKNCTLIFHQAPTGALPLGFTVDFRLLGPLVRPLTYRTPSIVKSWVRLWSSEFL